LVGFPKEKYLNEMTPDRKRFLDIMPIKPENGNLNDVLSNIINQNNSSGYNFFESIQ
jgi:hypothetical protein